MSGLTVGPMVSGTFIKMIGYWPTWLIAVAILVIDMIMRLIMIENPATPTKDAEESASDLNPSDETSSLLPRPEPSPGDGGQKETPQQNSETVSGSSETTTEPSSQNFYKVIFSNPRAVTAMVCHGVNALTLVSFDATLPLHVTRAFGWDTSRVSLMFVLLQLPTMLLSPLTGWVKDRFGTKVPTGIGFLATAGLLWVLGTPGPDGLSFVGSGERGQAVYIASMLGLGILRTLFTGCGVIEMTGKFSLGDAIPASVYWMINPVQCRCCYGTAGYATRSIRAKWWVFKSLLPYQYELDFWYVHRAYSGRFSYQNRGILLYEFLPW